MPSMLIWRWKILHLLKMFIIKKTRDHFSTALYPHRSRASYSAFTETGATQTMKTNQKAELKQQIPKSRQSNAQYKTMKFQLVRWPVMFMRLRRRLNVKLKPVELSCAYGFRNNFMLHSVYLRLLVDLENKSFVRVSLVIILPECHELNHCCRDGLRKPFKKWAVSLEQLSQGIWRAFFWDAKVFKPYIMHSDDIYLRVALLHYSYFPNQPVT